MNLVSIRHFIMSFRMIMFHSLYITDHFIALYRFRRYHNTATFHSVVVIWCWVHGATPANLILGHFEFTVFISIIKQVAHTSFGGQYLSKCLVFCGKKKKRIFAVLVWKFATVCDLLWNEQLTIHLHFEFIIYFEC